LIFLKKKSLLDLATQNLACLAAPNADARLSYDHLSNLHTFAHVSQQNFTIEQVEIEEKGDMGDTGARNKYKYKFQYKYCHTIVCVSQAGFIHACGNLRIHVRIRQRMTQASTLEQAGFIHACPCGSLSTNLAYCRRNAVHLHTPRILPKLQKKKKTFQPDLIKFAIVAQAQVMKREEGGARKWATRENGERK